MSLEFNWLYLLSALGSLSVGFASFIFTWYRTKVKGPNVQIIEIDVSSTEKTETVECYVDDTYKLDQWGFTLTFEGDKKVNLQLLIQNIGDRNAFIRIENVFLVGLAKTGILAYPMQKNPTEILRFFVNPTSANKLPIIKQIATDELSLVELGFHIPEGTNSMEDFVLIVDIKNWNHKGEESTVISEPSVFTSRGITAKSRESLKKVTKDLFRLKKKYGGFDIRGIFSILIKDFINDLYDRENIVKNYDQMETFNDQFELAYLLGDIYYSKYNKLKTIKSEN